MKVLVTGSNGQLGFCLQKTKPEMLQGQLLELVAIDRSHADLSAPESILAVLERYRPQVIINAAAYTAVDKAEADAENAQRINADLVKILADWCAQHNALLVHVSTDFVFDGTQSTAYAPEHPPQPLGVYGLTKHQGECHILASSCNAHIVRTGWVYAEQGANFVKTILRLARERDSLRIVADQVGTPTYARHLAQMIWQLVEQNPVPAIWHFSDAGTASWYDFATAIVDDAHGLGILEKSIPVYPIKTLDYPTPAKRPAFSVLDKEQTWKTLGVPPIHWRTALRSMLMRLSEQETK